MKEFKGVRDCNKRELKISELGWASFNDKGQDKMEKFFDDIGIVVVTLRAFGRFFAYNDIETLGSELTDEYEGQQWYDEILDIIYY